jgi:protein-disulfide isomerase-like protein with CxxC motif
VRLVSIVTAAGDLAGPSPEEFMRSHDLTFPVALDATDERLSDALGVQGYPTVYYVRPDGTVSEVTVGARSETDVQESMRAIAR